MNGLFRPEWSTLKKLMFLQSANGGSYATVTGNPVSFTAKAAPLKQLSVAFSPVQSGSGDPSPDNVRPISGWDGVTVERASEILAELTSSASANGVTCTTNSDGSVTVKGTCTGNVTLDFFRNSSAFPTGISAGGKYVVSIENPVDAFEVLSYKGVSATTLVSFSNADHAEFTVPSDATGLLVRILAKAGVTYDTTLHVRICPYDGYLPISISFGSTVYSGTLDVLTGVLTVDMAMQTLDGAQTVGMGTAANFRYFDFYDSAVETNAWETNVVSNFLKPNIGMSTGCRVQYTGQKCPRVVISTSESIFSSVDELKAYLQETPLTIVYPLATPITIQLTPQQVSSLLGENNMWSDANQPITVEYRKN